MTEWKKMRDEQASRVAHPKNDLKSDIIKETYCTHTHYLFVSVDG